MIVVRVKRHRDDEPAGAICLVESDSNFSTKRRKKLSELSLTDKKEDQDHSHHSAKVFLKRISTIDTSEVEIGSSSVYPLPTKALDDQTISVLNKRPQTAASSTNIDHIGNLDGSQKKRAKVIIPQRKRAVLNQNSDLDSYVLMDMLQLHQEPRSSSSVRSTSKILDPPTRSLRQGILLAIQRNDFTELSTALLKGGDGNYQLEEENGGFTALMVAAMKGNWRMVKRLILNGVNPLLRNTDGLTALDLLKAPSRTSAREYGEVRDLLQISISKALAAHSTALSDLDRNQELSEGQYVYDVYCVDSPPIAPPELQSEQFPPNGYISSVAIEGLKIYEDGQVELLSYDSDWSDLADDEDPDSNDERFYGNDYPDEDSEDNCGAQYFDGEEDYSSDEERQSKTNLAGRRTVSINPFTRYLPTDPARAPPTSYFMPSYSERKLSFKSHERALLNDTDVTNERSPEDLAMENQAIEQELEDMVNAQFGCSDGNSHALFDRNSSVGRVLRPHIIGENLTSEKNPRHLESDEIREIWGEETHDSNLHSSHQQRILSMRERTNMLFASNPKEFDGRGMPLFGMELSDDEPNAPFTAWSDQENENLPKDTIAYDSDLDHDSD